MSLLAARDRSSVRCGFGAVFRGDFGVGRIERVGERRFSEGRGGLGVLGDRMLRCEGAGVMRRGGKSFGFLWNNRGRSPRLEPFVGDEGKVGPVGRGVLSRGTEEGEELFRVPVARLMRFVTDSFM